MFLVFEGADGVGKTTQARLLAAHLRERLGWQTELLREPGGTELGERVRRILLDTATGDLEPQTELFLFMAARAQLVRERIQPALARGAVVVCDRYLWSSLVYQGMVGGLGVQHVLRVGRLAGAEVPTRIFLIDLPGDVTRGRMGRRDRMEQRGPAYQEQVRRGFLDLARRYPQKAVVISGQGSPQEVHRRVLERLPARGWSACAR